MAVIFDSDWVSKSPPAIGKAKECALFANKCAGTIVQEYGARLSLGTDYKELI